MERLSRHRSGIVTGSGASRAMVLYLMVSIALLLPGPTLSQADPTAPLCKIEIAPQGRLMQVTGVLLGPEPASGRYQLSVLKQGVSGQSRNMQSGAFVARADGTQTPLGAIAVRLAAGDAMSAELTIHVDDRLVCTATL